MLDLIWTKQIVAVEPSGSPFQSTIVKDAAAKLYGIMDIPLSNMIRQLIRRSTARHCRKHTHNRLPMVAEHTLCNESPRGGSKTSRGCLYGILLESGEASSHASYTEFTVQFLRQAGVSVQYLKLEDKGVRGNGHLQVLEKDKLGDY